MATNGIYGGSGIRSAGLISGLDTEALVKQMSAATKYKIDMQQQKLDLLSWKQNSYRSVIEKINSFKSSYFNIAKPDTNLGSNYLMGMYKAVSSNSKISATAGTNAAQGNYTITNIGKLAENARVESSASVSGGIRLDFSNAEADTDINLKITIDGYSKDITFNTGADADSAKANFQAAVQTAFNDTNIKIDGSNRLVYETAPGDKVTHTYSVGVSEKLDGDDYNKMDAALKSVGLTANTSNRISVNSKLENASFATDLIGGSFSFKINDVSFTFDKNATIKDVMNKVNSSKANVTMSFNSLSQKFSIESKDPGAAGELKIEQTTGNLLSVMFGNDTVSAGGHMSSNALKSSSLTGTKVTETDFSEYKNTTIQVTVNGVTKEIGIWGYDKNGQKIDYSDIMDGDGNIKTHGGETVAKVLNEDLQAEFGADAPKFEYNAATGQFRLVAASAGDTLTIGAKDYPAGSGSDLLQALGYIPRNIALDPPDPEAPQYEFITNALNGGETMKDLFGEDFVGGEIKVGGVSMFVDQNTTLEDLKRVFDVDTESGTITLKDTISADTEEGKALVSKLFGDTYENIAGFASSATGGAQSYRGTNAEITINGVTLTNTSNSIEIDGTTINIGDLTQADIDKINGGEEVTIGTSRDTSKAYDAIVKFVDDYNKLISDLHTEIKTSRPKSKGDYFNPLTDEQREAMSDKEIENWEEKAKEGLLYQDPNIYNFLTKLRTAMNTRTSDNFSLYDMGIKVSNIYTDNGKLEIDESKLKAALEANPDKVQELFTDTTRGLSAAVTKAIDGAVSTKSTSLGTLTRIAGVANTSTQTENSISKQIESYKKLIDTLETRYQNEQERYWRQFTSLETVMNRYNMQSSWLFSQFSNNG